MTGSVAGRDFFISFAGSNRSWAEWIAVELERVGYTTVVQTFDFRPGTDFVHLMQQAVSTCDRTIALLSPAYLTSDFGESEWRAAFVRDPNGEKGLLLPVLVQPCEEQALGVLSSRVWVDLVDADEAAARRKLLAAVDKNRPRPTTASYPGTRVKPGRFPGLGSAISNLAGRSATFAGREKALYRLHACLRKEAAPPAVALHGMGGVGKSEMAREYAHRFASDYHLTWWVDAEQATAVWAGLVALARKLQIADGADQAETTTTLFDALRDQTGWLLIYDNATSLAELKALLPPGDGHVIITSRSPVWSPRAEAMPLDVWDRAESIDFLRRRMSGPRHRKALLAKVADLVGDLPLALEEAATYLDETGIGLQDYGDLLEKRARELFDLVALPKNQADANGQRIATVWSLSLDQACHQEPAAEGLLNLLAFLHPTVPRDLPIAFPHLLPAPLAAAGSDPLAYNKLIAALTRFSLIKATPAELKLHRLVQAVIRGRLTPDDERTWAQLAVRLLRNAFPTGHSVTDRGRLIPQIEAVTAHALRREVAVLDTAWLNTQAAAHHREQGLQQRAKSVAAQVAETLNKFSTSDPEIVDRHADLGRLFLDLDDPAAAEVQFTRALQASEQMFGKADSRVAARHDDLGRMSEARNLFDEAEAHFGAALRIEPTAGRHAALGRVLQSRADYAEAHAHWRKAVELSAAEHSDGLEAGFMRNGLGNLLLETGQAEAAYEQFEQALTILEGALGPNHPHVAVAHNNLGSARQVQGNLEDARREYEIALRISSDSLGQDAPDIGIRLNNLATVLHAQGDLAGARAAYEKALRIGVSAFGPEHPALIAWYFNFALLLRDLRESDLAQDHGKRALRISESTLGTNHPQSRMIRQTLDLQAAEDS